MTATAVSVITGILFGVALVVGMIASALRKFAGWSTRASIFGASCFFPLILAIYLFVELRDAQLIADGNSTAGIVEFAAVAVPLLLVSSLVLVSAWELSKKFWR